MVVHWTKWDDVRISNIFLGASLFERSGSFSTDADAEFAHQNDHDEPAISVDNLYTNIIIYIVHILYWISVDSLSPSQCPEMPVYDGTDHKFIIAAKKTI